MSKKPDAQRRAVVRNAKLDKAHAQKQLKDMKAGRGSYKDTPTSRATFERHIAKQDRIIEENE